MTDRAIHSDYLVHWTGKDLDERYDPNWMEHPNGHSKTSTELAQRYVRRLANTLKFGLWMTVEPGSSYGPITLPDTPKCCFTELRLSESRRHAQKYGRLGIGVKRPFLFKRMGRPLAYFGFDQNSKDPLLNGCARDLQDDRLLHFFKPMNTDAKRLVYDYYDESEWRILLFQELLNKRLIVDPRDPQNVEQHKYFNSLSDVEQDKLKYLIPLDGWFSMIIYPSILAKSISQPLYQSEIPELIREIKSGTDHGNRVERGNWPIEINLDSCRHF